MWIGSKSVTTNDVPKSKHPLHDIKIKKSQPTLSQSIPHSMTMLRNCKTDTLIVPAFCFEKTLEIDQTIENGKQHEKK
jgi:hypothetical protein